MERFNALMDDMKEALVLGSENKGLFLPALIANIALFILGIIAFIIIMVTAIGSIASIVSDYSNSFNWAVLSGAIIGILIFLFVVGILFIALDVGITGLVIGVVDGEKPSTGLFFQAIKRHLISILLTKLGFSLLIMLSMILWIIPLILYMILVGSLTGGWGIVFLTCAIQALIGFWVLILVEDDRGGFNSIGVNLQFGKNNFWLLILIFYIQYNMAAYLPGLLGFIGAALISVFISYIITTYFKIILLKTYRRYRS